GSGAAPLTYSWTPTDGLSDPTAANPTANMTNNYTVNVTDGNGCWATDIVVVTENANPTADAGDDIGFCEGGSAVIGGSPTGSGAAPLTYSWTPTDGLSDPTAANPTANMTNNYTVNVTDGNGCWATDIVVVTENADPTADAGDDIGFCEGGSAVIGGSPTGSGAAPLTYSWTPTDGLSDPTAANPTANMTNNYTVNVTDGNGCWATDIVVVTENADPTADAGDDIGFCEGGSAVIGGSPTGSGAAPLTYSWTPTDGLSDPTAANPTANMTNNYTVNVTDGNGCWATDIVV
ncbi:unnamed protein product, partial [marine sediment metagenome]